jgi:hypothetical protein
LLGLGREGRGVIGSRERPCHHLITAIGDRHAAGVRDGTEPGVREPEWPRGLVTGGRGKDSNQSAGQAHKVWQSLVVPSCLTHDAAGLGVAKKGRSTDGAPPREPAGHEGTSWALKMQA